MIRQGKVLETASNLWLLLVAYSTFHVGSARDITLENPRLLKIPFGVAAALSTGLFFIGVSATRLLMKSR
jgi:hypothetical protein